jgi:hypothetical protein
MIDLKRICQLSVLALLLVAVSCNGCSSNPALNLKGAGGTVLDYGTLPPQELAVCESLAVKKEESKTANAVDYALLTPDPWQTFDRFHRAMGGSPEFHDWKVGVSEIHIIVPYVVLTVHLPCSAGVQLKNFDQTPAHLLHAGINPHTEILLKSPMAHIIGDLRQDQVISISGNLVYVPQCSANHANYISSIGGCAVTGPPDAYGYSLSVRYSEVKR